jgi:hypothetical protein
MKEFGPWSHYQRYCLYFGNLFYRSHVPFIDPMSGSTMYSYIRMIVAWPGTLRPIIRRPRG